MPLFGSRASSAAVSPNTLSPSPPSCGDSFLYQSTSQSHNGSSHSRADSSAGLSPKALKNIFKDFSSSEAGDLPLANQAGPRKARGGRKSSKIATTATISPHRDNIAARRSSVDSSGKGHLTIAIGEARGNLSGSESLSTSGGNSPKLPGQAQFSPSSGAPVKKTLNLHGHTSHYQRQQKSSGHTRKSSLSAADFTDNISGPESEETVLFNSLTGSGRKKRQFQLPAISTLRPPDVGNSPNSAASEFSLDSHISITVHRSPSPGPPASPFPDIDFHSMNFRGSEAPPLARPSGPGQFDPKTIMNQTQQTMTNRQAADGELPDDFRELFKAADREFLRHITDPIFPRHILADQLPALAAQLKHFMAPDKESEIPTLAMEDAPQSRVKLIHPAAAVRAALSSYSSVFLEEFSSPLPLRLDVDTPALELFTTQLSSLSQARRFLKQHSLNDPSFEYNLDCPHLEERRRALERPRALSIVEQMDKQQETEKEENPSQTATAQQHC